MQKRRFIWIGVPVEWDAVSIYTRRMFDKISGELYASGSFIVEETEGNCLYIVKRALVECNIDNESPIWKVKFIQSPHPPRLTCTCGLFEHMGMPCKHMLKVLDDLLFTAVLIIVVAQKMFVILCLWVRFLFTMGLQQSQLGMCNGVGQCAPEIFLQMM